MNSRTLLNTLCSLALEDRRKWLENFLRERFPKYFKVDLYNWEHEDSKDLLFKGMPALFHGPKESRNFCLHFGENTSKSIVGAHYDVVSGVEGGNDNTAAVVQLISAANAIAAMKPEHQPDVTIVFFDWEEKIGTKYMGSNTYNFSHPSPERALILDVTGIGEMFLSKSQTSDSVLKKYEGVLPQFGTPPSDTINFLHIKGCETALLCAAPPEQIAAGGYLPIWRDIHSSEDTAAKIEDSALWKGTQFVLHWIDKVYEK